MKLVTGGAYQGKLAYAKREYQIEEGWIDGRDCRMEALASCRGIHHFHAYVKRMTAGEEGTEIKEIGSFGRSELTEMEQQAQAFADYLQMKNPYLVVVSNELGCGVVPMEKEERLWREAAGRICTCIAAQADEVVRVVCGIGMRLK